MVFVFTVDFSTYDDTIQYMPFVNTIGNAEPWVKKKTVVVP